jgi:hyperosmotically inducible protein
MRSSTILSFKHFPKYIRTGSVFMGLILSLGCARGDNTAENSADNSARNQEHSKTAESQKDNDRDVAITQKIRQAITNDNAISTNGKNIKIITENGNVTLKGPVDTQQEKENIGNKAGLVSGVTKVDNQLEVKNP